LEDRGFESHPMINGNGFKAMLGSITAPNSGSLLIEKKENKGSQMGHTKKYLKNWRMKQERSCNQLRPKLIQSLRLTSS